MRLDSQAIQALMKAEGVDRIWSWSKWNCFHNSPYEYYLKYIRHVKEDRADSIYTTTGGIAHDILEKFYTGQLPYEKMADDFEDGWITAFDIANLKFDRNDEAHNVKIASNYHDNLAHFFANHTVVKYKVMIEQFVKAMIGGNLFQGYIDICFKDDDGFVNIIDNKTSSIYTGKKAEQEAGQLIGYTIGLHQKGIPYEIIKAGWNFLKYVTIQYEQANGAVKTRNVERTKIGDALQANAKTWLKKLGYANDMDTYLKNLLDTNSIECLPKDVQAKYVISDCYVYLDLTEQLIQRWHDDIVNQITDIEAREHDYYEMKERGLDEETCSKAFWDTDESVQANSYYFSTLCAYSPSLHLPYKAYLERIEKEKNAANVFGGVGEGVEIQSTDKLRNDIAGDIDLSWLNEI